MLDFERFEATIWRALMPGDRGGCFDISGFGQALPQQGAQMVVEQVLEFCRVGELP
jgi:hypothetical protein